MQSNGMRVEARYSVNFAMQFAQLSWRYSYGRVLWLVSFFPVSSNDGSPAVQRNCRKTK